MKPLTWKRERARPQRFGYYDPEPGWRLVQGRTALAEVRPLTEGPKRRTVGWWWSICIGCGIFSHDTRSAPVADAETAKTTCEAYVRGALGIEPEATSP